MKLMKFNIELKKLLKLKFRLILQERWVYTELKKILETGFLSPEEEQLTLCNIASFYSRLPNAPIKTILGYLEEALKKAPNSFRAKTIKEDIEYLKAKN